MVVENIGKKSETGGLIPLPDLRKCVSAVDSSLHRQRKTETEKRTDRQTDGESNGRAKQ